MLLRDRQVTFIGPEGTALGRVDLGQARRLLRLPSSALLVDTPGMREVGLSGDDGGVDATFDDILADATVTNKEGNPENGGYLESTPPPAATIVLSRPSKPGLPRTPLSPALPPPPPLAKRPTPPTVMAGASRRM